MAYPLQPWKQHVDRRSCANGSPSVGVLLLQRTGSFVRKTSHDGKDSRSVGRQSPLYTHTSRTVNHGSWGVQPTPMWRSTACRRAETSSFGGLMWSQLYYPGHFAVPHTRNAGVCDQGDGGIHSSPMLTEVSAHLVKVFVDNEDDEPVGISTLQRVLQPWNTHTRMRR